MTKPRSAVLCPREPIGLSLDEAARFVGLSAGTFERLVREGVMPFARSLAGRRIWAADEITAAFLKIPPSPPMGLISGASPIQLDCEDPYDRVRA